MADRNGYIGRAPSDSSVTVARQTFSPTGVTTDFTFASGYTPGYFDIFINGVKMIEGSDYTSTDGSTFSVLNGGVVSGDVIEGVAYKAFNAATASVGIYSGGDPISTQANILNFVGTGNTFALRGSTVDISISGGAGAGGTWANYDTNTGVSTTKKVKIENDLEVTGVTTSTGGFVGNVTGTATGLSGTPDITIQNLTGVAATFTGVLTYEDVTNIDSLGIITARSHVSIADSILHTGDTDTSIRFPAANTFTVETGGSEALRVNSSGRLLLGTTNESSNKNTITPSLSVSGDDVAGSAQITRHTTLADGGAHLNLASTRGNDANSYTIVQDEDGIGTVAFNAADGNEFVTAAEVKAQVDGTPGDNDMPGRLVFLTTASGASDTTERMRITSTGEVRVGSAFSVSQAGVCTAAEFHGDGSNLTNLPAASISTTASTVSGIVTTLQLSSAQDHKLTVSGITTITCSGGSEGDSHTVRIINSGITTVGFSTFFLFPSGADPIMPTADGAISLISFTVNRVGAGGTQLLAGAALNYS